MASAGDIYTVTLKESHLDWGEYRNPTNRVPISGEGYIPIPRQYAEAYKIYNSNYKLNGFGYNLFYASSADGYLQDVTLLAQGCSEKGDIYAKQFSVKGDLQAIGSWYNYMNAHPGSEVIVEWTSSDTIFLTLI